MLRLYSSECSVCTGREKCQKAPSVQCLLQIEHLKAVMALSVQENRGSVKVRRTVGYPPPLPTEGDQVGSRIKTGALLVNNNIKLPF